MLRYELRGFLQDNHKVQLNLRPIRKGTRYGYNMLSGLIYSSTVVQKNDARVIASFWICAFSSYILLEGSQKYIIIYSLHFT